jgi:hypothetical protein
MKIQLYLIFFLLLSAFAASGQDILYFHKIENVTASTQFASLLYKRIDSIKQTRRPNDSKVAVFFDRDIDFGYRHQRITVTFNSIFYQVNLLVKNDSIYFSSVLFDNNYYDKVYSKFNAIKIDTNRCLKYLQQRNDFYKSTKKLSDLKDDLNLNEEYAFYCGDGNLKTFEGKYIEGLVKNKKINKLINLSNSLSCEEQAYGETGLVMLQKEGYKLPSNIIRIVTHIKARNSELVVCEGCIGGLLKKEYGNQ